MPELDGKDPILPLPLPLAEKQPLGQLQSEMISAVRGAITGVMARRGPADSLAHLDLDFSVSGKTIPALKAEPDRALTLPTVSKFGTREKWLLGLSAGAVSAVMLGGGWILSIWQMNQTAPPLPIKAAVAAPVPVAPAIPATVVILPRAEPAIAKAAEPVVATPPQDLLDIARRLIHEGRIVEARKLLLSAEPPERSAVALVLAQIYDPNFLSSLPQVDAAPDAEQARIWYRHWYDLALKDGAVPETMRLDLLLRSLDKTAAAK